MMLRVNKKSTPVVDAEGNFQGNLKYNAVVKAAKASRATVPQPPCPPLTASPTSPPGGQGAAAGEGVDAAGGGHRLRRDAARRPRARHGERGRGPAARRVRGGQAARPRDAHRRAARKEAVFTRRRISQAQGPMRRLRRVRAAEKVHRLARYF